MTKRSRQVVSLMKGVDEWLKISEVKILKFWIEITSNVLVCKTTISPKITEECRWNWREKCEGKNDASEAAFMARNTTMKFIFVAWKFRKSGPPSHKELWLIQINRKFAVCYLLCAFHGCDWCQSQISC